MKLLLTTCCSVLLAAIPAAAQTRFTGTITYTMSSGDGQSINIVQSSKGPKLRVDQATAGGSRDGSGAGMTASVIYDHDARTLTILLHDQRVYIARPAPDATAMTGPGDSATFAATGKSKTVAGVTCTMYRIHTIRSGRPEDGDACMAKGVGVNPLDMESATGSAANSPAMRAMQDFFARGYGMLEATALKGGTSSTALLVTSISRTPPSDDMFKPPTDYKPMAAGGILNGGAQK